MRWRCQKCGREFSKTNQDHYCLKPKSVDDYIATKNEEQQLRLEEMRLMIREAIPEAEERIAWSMPTYWKGKNILHFAAAKNHLSLFPGSKATAFFADQLTAFDVSKGTIRFSYDQSLPKELIQRIARWCYQEFAQYNH